MHYISNNRIANPLHHLFIQQKYNGKNINFSNQNIFPNGIELSDAATTTLPRHVC